MSFKHVKHFGFTMQLLLLHVVLYSCSDTKFGSDNSKRNIAPLSASATTSPTPSPNVSTAPSQALPVATNAVECGDPKPGFMGLVYRLPAGTSALPNFPSLTSEGQVRSANLDVPKRSWTSGFPGVSNLVEWFSIDFVTVLDVQTEGSYYFKTTSDDGSKVYLDGDLLVDNDGNHPPRSIESTQPKILSKGKYRLRVSWYQGPRKDIALQLFWKKPGDNAFSRIPDELLAIPDACNTKNLGVWP